MLGWARPLFGLVLTVLPHSGAAFRTPGVPVLLAPADDRRVPCHVLMATPIDPNALSALGAAGTATRDLATRRTCHEQALLRRATHLDDGERRLFEAHIIRGLTVRQLAGLLDIHAGSVARRIRSIQRRLVDPNVAAVVDAGGALSLIDRQIAIGHLLRRRPVASIAADVRKTPPIVRQRLQYIRGWLKGRRDGAFAMRVAMQQTREAA